MLGQFDVIASKSHAYAEEGHYTVTTLITDTDADHVGAAVTPSTTTAVSTATVQDAALASSGVAVAATEGAAVSGVTVATFTDADPAGVPGDYTAAIDWGDGDTTASYSIVADADVLGQFDVIASKSHAYAEEGHYTVTTLITDTDADHVGAAVTPSTTTAVSTATVQDAALASSGVAVAATEGAAVSGVTVATFSDADPGGNVGDYAATIDWGDGDTTASYSIVADASVLGQFDVIASKSHAYAEEGHYTVTTVITETDADPRRRGGHAQHDDGQQHGHGPRRGVGQQRRRGGGDRRGRSQRRHGGHVHRRRSGRRWPATTRPRSTGATATRPPPTRSSPTPTCSASST